MQPEEMHRPIIAPSGHGSSVRHFMRTRFGKPPTPENGTSPIPAIPPPPPQLPPSPKAPRRRSAGTVVSAAQPLPASLTATAALPAAGFVPPPPPPLPVVQGVVVGGAEQGTTGTADGVVSPTVMDCPHCTYRNNINADGSQRCQMCHLALFT
eukprot:NODE_682_length_813_cov_368.366492_g516_i0.p1 GENE.NODE_682_length_813_cov_368.366492_g516_i0~~NODE_682_length_813_cov_368.366492_g516_i0.p1  ORF type:complete len:153 (-),score=38.99 NODE_682_length_813_cov_368.366492_g516_i0:66-524(-)